MDATLKRELEVLNERYADLEAEQASVFDEMVGKVWPLLKTRDACREVLETVGDNAQLRYFVTCRHDALPQ